MSKITTCPPSEWREEIPTEVWLHWCGHINTSPLDPQYWPGYYPACSGCGYEVTHPGSEVLALAITPTNGEPS